MHSLFGGGSRSRAGGGPAAQPSSTSAGGSAMDPGASSTQASQPQQQQQYPPPPATPSLDRLPRPKVQLYGWGRNDMGQLGLVQQQQGDTGSVGVPTLVEALASKDVVGMAGGPFHSAFVTADGELYTSGCNDNGQLGRKAAGGGAGLLRSLGAGGGCPACRPGHVSALEATVVAAAGCGAGHTLAVSEQGQVFSWGDNEFGQLGWGSEGGEPSNPQPRHVRAVHGRVVRLAVGSNHALLLTGGGQVLAVGQGSYGALGIPGQTSNQPSPVVVPALMAVGVVQVAAGEFHSAALSVDGRLFTWGRGKYGQLGHGDWNSLASPKPVATLRGLRATQVACGGDHTLVITSGTAGASGPTRPTAAATTSSSAGAHSPQGQGQVLGGGSSSGGSGGSVSVAEAAALAACEGCGVLYAFGRGTWGATGLGGTDNTFRPARVRGLLEGESVVQVSAGQRHTCALTASNAVFAWGNNDFGQLGLGTSPARPATADPGGPASPVEVHPSPRRVQGLPPGAPVLCILAAGDHSAALVQQPTAAVQPFSSALGRLGSSLRAAATGGSGGGGTSLAATASALGTTSSLGCVTPGPRPGRRHGLYDTPYEVPDLVRLAAAASTAGGDPRAMREVVQAIEEVFTCPGYVLAHFANGTASTSDAFGAAVHGQGSRSSTGGAGAGAREAYAVLRRPGQLPPPLYQHGLDAAAVQACYEALLRLYDADVVTALGNSLLQLLPEEPTALVEEAEEPSSSNRQPKHSRRNHPNRPHPSYPNSGVYGSGLPSQIGGAATVTASDADDGTTGGIAGGTAAATAAAAAAAAACAGSPLVGGVRVDSLRLLFLAVQCPLLAGAGRDVRLGNSLASRLVRLSALPQEAVQLLATWLAALPPEVFGGRVVRPLQNYMAQVAAAGGGTGYEMRRPGVLTAAALMRELSTANDRAGGVLPYTEFYNPLVSAAANLREEYLLWLQVGGREYDGRVLLSLCQFPAVLTLEAKSRMLQGEAMIQKEAEVSHSAQEALMQGLHPASALFLDISVRRTSLLADTAQQLALRPAHQLKRPLRVSFISNGLHEEGVDQGGVSREFFQLLVAEIFQPQYGMFVYSEETRTFWFNHTSLESGMEFKLVGVMLGLAIYNGIILPLHFPQVVYKKLLGEPVGLQDLTEAFPTLGRSLEAVLDMDPDQVEDVLCRNFEVSYDFFGETRVVPLEPGGSGTAVTGANRERYVARLVEWTLDESVDEQFGAFAQGFHQVCGGPALSLLRHEELELLVCGLPHLDFGALEAQARYEGGYHKQHPTIVTFWQVLSELDVDAKRRFLAFTTGCDRAPVGGLGSLVLTVQRSGPDSERLPSAHTCFNVLLLPDYASRAKLRAKLLTAIDNAQGFGLK